MSTSGTIKKRKRPNASPSNNAALRSIPKSSHYEVSYMHRSTVTRVVSSNRYGYILTCSNDGILKFWKRTPPPPPSFAGEKDAKEGESRHDRSPCVEFVKSYVAHNGQVRALCLSSEEDTAASAGGDGVIKIYDVRAFDVTGMIASTKKLGTHAVFVTPEQSILAICAERSPDIYLFSTSELSPEPVSVISVHGKPVTCLGYIPSRKMCVSCDLGGIVEFWDCSSPNPEGGMGGAPSEKNGISYGSKMETDLYSLVGNKTFAVAMAVHPLGTKIALYGNDRKIKLFSTSSGKCLVTFDERMGVYESSKRASLDAIEYGKRAATEREIQDSPVFTGGNSHLPHILSDECGSQLLSVSFDLSGLFFLYPTLLGIKVIDLTTNKVIRIIGKPDATARRFLSVCVCSSDPRMDKQMQLARMGGDGRPVMGANAHDQGNAIHDPLLITTCYNKKRLYVFSTRDIQEDKNDNDNSTAEALVHRDILNEPPDADDLLLNAATHDNVDDDKLGKEAILRTTVGDVHFKLFGEDCPKSVENFCTHARNGYYNEVLFHRVIKGFMIQTGDPLGDGTGGESIWGGEFKDEIVRDLRHDRPFTVSMANSGPNTNGSQFFITTVPTPWLDQKHTVFGRVTKGMDVISQLENVPCDDGDRPKTDVHIMSIDIL